MEHLNGIVKIIKREFPSPKIYSSDILNIVWPAATGQHIMTAHFVFRIFGLHFLTHYALHSDDHFFVIRLTHSLRCEPVYVFHHFQIENYWLSSSKATAKRRYIVNQLIFVLLMSNPKVDFETGLCQLYSRQIWKSSLIILLPYCMFIITRLT